MKVNIKRLTQKATLPKFSTDGSVGADLYACVEQPIVLAAAQRALIPTGLSIELPVGYGGFVFARSSLASKHGISLSNCVGVIDSDYRGELKVAVINHSDTEYCINHGDRIAQLVVMPYVKADYIETKELTQTTRIGGFGSTGI
ncbi:MAG: dUTP diphosphatase [Oscillospiraceae bacterium]|nr:dUTP diphosphatase [Oscillospiraceae bacterium]